MGSINGSLDLMGRHRILENTLYKNEAEGNPVSFKTNVTKNLKECVVELSPKQDFNGYDHPWVEGGGKNLFNNEWMTQNAASGTVTFAHNGTKTRITTDGVARYMGTTYSSVYDLPAGTYYIKFKIEAGATLTSYSRVGLRNRSNNTTVKSIPITPSTLEYAVTVTTTEATYFSYIANDANTGSEYATDVTIYDIIVSKTDSEFEPYKNICPIYYLGRKNLIPWPVLDNTSVNGITASIVDDELRLSGTATAAVITFFLASRTNNYSEMHYGVFPPGTYSVILYGFVGQQLGDRIVFTARYSDGTAVTNTSQRISAPAGVVADGSGRIITFTATKPFKASVWVCVESGTTINCACKIMMVRGSAIDEYQPYTEAIVSQTGKNLCGVATLSNVGWAYQSTLIKNILNSLEIGTYTISFDYSITSVSDVYTSDTATAYTGRFYVFAGSSLAIRQNGVEITRSQALSGYSGKNVSIFDITAENKGKFTSVYFYGLGRDRATEGAPNGILGYADITNIQLELGSTATAYEPYNPTSQQYTVTWENDIGEVFGGTLNLTTGELIAEYAEAVIDGTGSITSQVYSENYPNKIRAWCALTGTHAPNGNINCRTLPLYSDSFTMYAREGGWDQPWADSGHYNLEEANIGDCINVSQYPYSLCYILPFGGGYGVQENSIQAIKDYFAAHPVRIVGKLYIPITYHLTPVQIKTLLETNVLTTDGDNIRVTYWKH